jgi:hypothetical protein
MRMIKGRREGEYIVVTHPLSLEDDDLVRLTISRYECSDVSVILDQTQVRYLIEILGNKSYRAQQPTSPNLSAFTLATKNDVIEISDRIKGIEKALGIGPFAEDLG